MKAKHFKWLWDSLLPLATEDVIDELPFMCRSWQSEVLDKSLNLITHNVPQTVQIQIMPKTVGNLLILPKKKRNQRLK